MGALTSGYVAVIKRAFKPLNNQKTSAALQRREHSSTGKGKKMTRKSRIETCWVKTLQRNSQDSQEGLYDSDCGCCRKKTN